MINMLPVHYQGMVAGEQRDPAAADGQRVRLRPRGDGPDARRQRGPPDRPERHRPRARRRGRHDRAGLPRMLTTWDQRMRREGIKVTRLQFPVPATQDFLYNMFEKAITPKTKVFHFTHITNLTAQLFPVQAALAPGPVQGHRHHRRRRPRPGAVPVQAPRPRVRRLRRQPAQVAAGPARQRLPLRPQGDDPAVLAAPGRARAAGQRHPQVRVDRDPSLGHPGGPRRVAGLPPGHRRRAQGGPPALPQHALGQRPQGPPPDQGPDGHERAGPGLGRHGRLHRGHRRPASWPPSCGTTTGSSASRSSAGRRRTRSSTTRPSASRRTSTRRSRRSTRSSRPWQKPSRNGVPDAPDPVPAYPADVTV
ncbi:MAG: hypothetical protein M0C28_35875 [Candidatus Moduliflexus flocculans]|nr:hypothetical protein [Candidatus Moduliflexus flocculans]